MFCRHPSVLQFPGVTKFPSTFPKINVIARSCRDVELAKFEAFLAKQGGYDVNAMVRGRQELAYPIRKCVFTTPE